MKNKNLALYDFLPEFYKQLDNRKISALERLPEIYIKKISETFSADPYQLKSFLSLFEDIFKHIYKNIENLYHDFFIETCEPWVIPYIGDLIGISHLKGDLITLRADVADAVHLLRRKGTLSVIKRLVSDLTNWGVYCLELKDKMLINQNINLYSDITLQQKIMSTQLSPIDNYFKNCLVEIRDPAFLELMKTPFNPFAHIADLKPSLFNNLRYNIPNLAVFLWRLKTYQLQAIKPVIREDDPKKLEGEGGYLIGFDIHPLGRNVRLFNYSMKWASRSALITWNSSKQLPIHLAQIDETPGKILTARLMENSRAGNPSKYLRISRYYYPYQLQLNGIGLTLYIPGLGHNWNNWPSDQENNSRNWIIRGEDLSEWEKCVIPPLKDREIAIDPKIGRILIRVNRKKDADALRDDLYINYTYGISGNVGAHPSSQNLDDEWKNHSFELIEISGGNNALDDKIKKLFRNKICKKRVVIEIQDSLIYKLNFTDIKLMKSLYIRASENQRPIITLARPLQFSPVKLKNKNEIESTDSIAPRDDSINGDTTTLGTSLEANEREQDNPSDRDDTYIEMIKNLVVRLEGLFLSRAQGLAQKNPLITRAALNSLEINRCTLDPGGYKRISKQLPRAQAFPSMHLDRDYGYSSNSKERQQFKEIPEIRIENCICGALLIADTYTLYLKNSIIDAGEGTDIESAESDAIGAPPNPKYPWGAPTVFDGITVFGLTKVKSICGKGAIFVHPVYVFNIMKGCIQYSYINGDYSKTPQKEKCIQASEVFPRLQFVDEKFGEPGYTQLAYNIDKRIKEKGPNNNAMGAFGFLCEEDKWRNLSIRFREFMPVGIRPIYIVKT